MELTISAYPHCQCGVEMLPMFDNQRDTHEAYVKGWYCTKCNKLYLLGAGEMRWKVGREWTEKTETRETY